MGDGLLPIVFDVFYWVWGRRATRGVHKKRVLKSGAYCRAEVRGDGF
jgi:hypothetical protein